MPEPTVVGGALHILNKSERGLRGIVASERSPPTSWAMRGLRAASGALVLVAGSLALSSCERPAAQSQSQIADGVRFEYGVVPSSVPAEHSTNHSEASMHGGAPRLENNYHIVLGIFESSSGARITHAKVVIHTTRPDHPGTVETPLEPMSINGDMSYGGYIALPDATKYLLTFKVSRPHRLDATAAFLFDRPRSPPGRGT
jgi:hypothetical protein